MGGMGLERWAKQGQARQSTGGHDWFQGRSKALALMGRFG
jgi:hypothetical protein